MLEEQTLVNEAGYETSEDRSQQVKLNREICQVWSQEAKSLLAKVGSGAFQNDGLFPA
jgi:hypothetical protein